MLLARFLFLIALSSAAPIKRNPYNFLQPVNQGDTVFELGNNTYLANARYPKATFSCDLTSSVTAGSSRSTLPITVINTNASTVTRGVLTTTIQSYLDGDDVFTTDFLEAIYISSSSSGATLDSSAISYLRSLEISHVFMDASISVASGNTLSTTTVASPGIENLPSGPYLALINAGTVSLASVFLLYPDTYRDFLFGAYDSNDGNATHSSVGVFLPKVWDPYVPVPSRIYSWNDPRPMAGYRVAIKDLFDIKGLQTSGGSQAWAHITPTANETAPSIQRILDLGGVLVGKYKLAQFASGANPWEWQDEHYPFNPRGDGWLTCSASSSGGGCSVAAYDWLDFAIGSDTGSSMRRPAAVSGTFGQRPSQGLMSLERVLPLGGATDTAGVFSRDPYKWIAFSKAWYQPTLYQPPNITGLSPLEVPDTLAFPKNIIYPTDYLPLNNSAAEVVLQNFITNLTTIFNMTVKKINFTETVQSIQPPDNVSFINNLTYLSSVPLGVINAWTAWDIIGSVLTSTWSALFDGRFPPIDPARRPGWKSFNTTRYNPSTYANALVEKNAAVEWWESSFQPTTSDSCSENVFLYDIGTGGFPSYRELALNGYPNTSFLAVKPPGAEITGANICPIYGCADFTIPIGQVPYYSNVTFHEEMVPVTINMVVKRGCDFMLLNMIEKLADRGVLSAVKTGRTAF
ncbi:uncharacterized protein N0V89_007173 [Didymosphaeria variabile]|uniref:Amidase family protein n=1 Tax=Didymosphaeria variabile TaxID=1932322 RepID=A0A9W8XIN6_9PLEO|nr:uncharacterized protein N0V89_007173 [Didymosphaeria variabile]KAJ4351829.1 hypothetical protein N0V89_007173 [Didymosphaeria variabile]